MSFASTIANRAALATRVVSQVNSSNVNADDDNRERERREEERNKNGKQYQSLLGGSSKASSSKIHEKRVFAYEGDRSVQKLESDCQT